MYMYFQSGVRKMDTHVVGGVRKDKVKNTTQPSNVMTEITESLGRNAVLNNFWDCKYRELILFNCSMILAYSLAIYN